MRKFWLLIFAIAACPGLAGCGIAHKFVSVPTLDVQFLRETPEASESVQFQVVRPEFWAEREIVIALVKDSLASDGIAYEQRSVTMQGNNQVSVLFPTEQRYVGYAVFIVAFGPDDETNHRRVLFIVDRNADFIYRVIIFGNRATISAAGIRAVNNRLPSTLLGPPPYPLAKEWQSWFEAEGAFYQSVQWSDALQMRARQLIRSTNGDVLLLEVAR